MSSDSPPTPPLQPWADDVALVGPDAPKSDGKIKHLIEYLLTVHDRFGNTRVTFKGIQWGASALWKSDEQEKRIAELESELEIAKACAEVGTAPCGHSDQYCYSEDGGKNIVCLLCERASFARSEKSPASPHCSQHGTFEPDCLDCSDALGVARDGEGWRNDKSVLPPMNSTAALPESDADARRFLNALLCKPVDGVTYAEVHRLLWLAVALQERVAQSAIGRSIPIDDNMIANAKLAQKVGMSRVTMSAPVDWILGDTDSGGVQK